MDEIPDNVPTIVAALSLQGQVALVTGAARGLGRAVCFQLAKAGAAIIAFDIAAAPTESNAYPTATEADLEATVADLEALGGRALAVRGDVRRREDLTSAVEQGVAAFGSLDVVVANAGITRWGRSWELSIDDWKDVIDINLTGCWNTFAAAAPVLIEAGRGGSMIAISSVAGLKPLPGLSHYSASKAGVVGLVRSSAVELGVHRIRVNSVHPWAMDTDMGRTDHTSKLLETDPAYADAYHSALQVPLPMPVDVVAHAVHWLAAPASWAVTGAQIPVDAGATLV
jgi:SDR family mycofactocin-dependent oxidoreductase